MVVKKNISALSVEKILVDTMGSTFSTADTVFGSSSPKQPLALPVDIDLERFCGLWYQIASLPNITRNMRDVRVTYRLERRATGQPVVLTVNQAYTNEGEFESWAAVAIPLEKHNTRWTVDAVGCSARHQASKSELLILAVDYDRFQWAMVGSHDTLAVLSRSTSLDEETLRTLLIESTDVHGYDVTKLEYTLHTPGRVIPEALPTNDTHAAAARPRRTKPRRPKRVQFVEG
jgi:lipocalin